MSIITEFPRIENKLKLCYSMTLDCKICFDTGSDVDIVPSSLLSRFKEKGFAIEEYKTDTKAVSPMDLRRNTIIAI